MARACLKPSSNFAAEDGRSIPAFRLQPTDSAVPVTPPAYSDPRARPSRTLAQHVLTPGRRKGDICCVQPCCVTTRWAPEPICQHLTGPLATAPGPEFPSANS